jgi:hypothetical protein
MTANTPEVTPESVLRELLTFDGTDAAAIQSAQVRLRAATALFAHELDPGDDSEPDDPRDGELLIRVRARDAEG